MIIKLNEIKNDFFNWLHSYLIESPRQYVTERYNATQEYITASRKAFKEDPTAEAKKQTIALFKAIYWSAGKIFNLALSVAAFLLFGFLVIEALKFAIIGELAAAAILLIPAAIALRYSGNKKWYYPYNIITTAIAAPIKVVAYVVKTIALTILDHLIEAFGIAAHVKDRPKGQFFQADSLIDPNEDGRDVTDKNPMLRADVSADSAFRLTLGPITFTPSAALQYVFPHDITQIKTFFIKQINNLIYISGLEGRARKVANYHKIEEKNMQELDSSILAEKNFLEMVNIQVQTRVAYDLSPSVASLEEALDLIINNKDFAKLKLPQGQNWLHYLQKIKLSTHLLVKYSKAALNIMDLGISPYERDQNGDTAFGGSHSINDNNELLRKIRHGEYPDIYGLDAQISWAMNFLNNAKNNMSEDSNKEDRIIGFTGPPGVGKTKIAQMIAEKAGFDFVEYRKGSAGDKWVGGQTDRIKRQFDRIKESGKPTIIFMDEADAVLHNNEHNTTHEAQPISVFQTEISALVGTNCVFMVATNYPERLKDAILSRLGILVQFHSPNTQARRDILANKLRMYKIKDGEAIIAKIAEITCGLSARDLESFVSNLARLALADENRNNKKELLLKDFATAFQQLMATKSQQMPHLKVLYPNLIPIKKSEDVDLLNVEKDVLNKLQLLPKFFDMNNFALRVDFNKDPKRVLFTGFSAKKHISAIADHATCATLYFDAADLDNKKEKAEFLKTLCGKLHSYEKVLLVIDNVEKLNESELKKLSNEGGLLYIIGATEKVRLENGEVPSTFNMWKEKIEVKPTMPDEKNRADLIRATIVKAERKGLPSAKYLADSSNRLAALCDGMNVKEITEVMENSFTEFLDRDQIEVRHIQPKVNFLHLKDSVKKVKEAKETEAARAEAEPQRVERIAARGFVDVASRRRRNRHQ